MGDRVRIPRSRGALCGLMLLLLGAWGGVGPYAGPSFRFGFTPDRAWAYTQGRLYLSAIPGVAVVLAGLLVMTVRSRWFGGFCALVAALAGAWFIAGAALIRLLPASLGVASVSPGTPLGAAGTRATLTEMALFTGVGAAIVFFAALALGRFSIVGYRDYLRAQERAESASDRDAGLAGLGLAGLGLAPPATTLGSYAADQASAATMTAYPAGLTGQPQYVGGQAEFPSQYPADFDTAATGPFPAGDPAQPQAPEPAGPYLHPTVTESFRRGQNSP
jgi:hypothetical protein